MADGSREHEATEEQRACAEVLSVSVGTSESAAGLIFLPKLHYYSTLSFSLCVLRVVCCVCGLSLLRFLLRSLLCLCCWLLCVYSRERGCDGFGNLHTAS